MNTQDYIREFVYITFIQKRTILITTLITFLIGVLVAFLWPPTYLAESKILVKQKKIPRSPETLEEIRPRVPQVTESDVFSEMELMTSTDVIRMAVTRLQKETKIFPNNMPEGMMRDLIANIRRNLTVEVLPRSNVFKATLYWNDPIQAELILKTHVDMYLQYRTEIFGLAAAGSFFKQQFEGFQNNLQQLEDQLIDLTTQSKAPIPQEEIKSNLRLQQMLEQDLHKLLSAYIEKKRLLRYIKGQLKSNDFNSFAFIDNDSIASFGKQLQALIVKREDLLKLYNEQAEPVRRIKEQIHGMSKALRQEVSKYVEGETAKLKAMEEAIESLKSRIETLRSENVKLFRDNVRTQSLERQLRLIEDSWSIFSKRWEEAKLDQSSAASNLFTVSVVSTARADTTPIFPNKSTLLPSSMAVSILFGFTAGFLREFFDHTFKRPEDVEKYVNLKTLFSIPEYR